jgi:hypothetical protein
MRRLVPILAIVGAVLVALTAAPAAYATGCPMYTLNSPSQPYKSAKGAWLMDSHQWSFHCGPENFRVEGRAEVLNSGSWQFLADAPRYAPSSTGYYSGGNTHTGEFIGYELTVPGTTLAETCASDYRVHFTIIFTTGATINTNSPAMQC